MTLSRADTHTHTLRSRYRRVTLARNSSVILSPSQTRHSSLYLVRPTYSAYSLPRPGTGHSTQLIGYNLLVDLPTSEDTAHTPASIPGDEELPGQGVAVILSPLERHVSSLRPPTRSSSSPALRLAKTLTPSLSTLEDVRLNKISPRRAYLY